MSPGRRWSRASSPAEAWIRVALLVGINAFLIVTVALPIVELLDRSLHEDVAVSEGERMESKWIGISRFTEYFAQEGRRASLTNSLFASSLTTGISVLLAFLYAFGIQRTSMRLKPLFRGLAMVPLFGPTMLYGLSLIHLFGRQGLITTGFFGRFAWMASDDVWLYGIPGIVIAEVVFTFPAAYLILLVALSNVDRRLYEASSSLGASSVRTFFTVTVPGIKFGLASAVFVVFTLTFTDFGAPKVVGGNTPILAVEIYKHVVGQMDFGMGATVSIILLVPAGAAFAIDRALERRRSAALTAGSVPYAPSSRPVRDAVFFSICSVIALFILIMVGVGGYASLVRMWPYDFGLGLDHYDFSGTGSGSYQEPATGLLAFLPRPYWVSLEMSFYTALAGTLVTFLAAYVIEKTRRLGWLRRTAYLLSVAPLALPGLVIGISFIFLFNRETIGFGIENPLRPLYGTMALLVLSNVVHFFTVGFLTATTALRQLDREFEEVGESLGVPFWTTLWRVTLPVSLPAILEIAMYFFVSSMTTVSAVIFLYRSDIRPASVAVVHMDDAGDQAAAAALCTLIVLTNVLVRILFELATWLIHRRTGAWRGRSIHSGDGVCYPSSKRGNRHPADP